MAQSHRAVRGMRDILPDESGRWQDLENKIAQTMYAFGYQQIRLPVLESTALFCRSIGEETDIVGKEMYTFNDRNGDSLTLRPEGTASCLRAGIEHGLFHNQRQKLWYQGPMFRHERPQQGRYRQFDQWGVEAVGYPGIECEAELLLMTWQLWQDIGIADSLTLELNSLGDDETRKQYRQHLQTYFEPYQEQLTDAELKRLHENPLRLLDSKNPKLEGLIAKAPTIDAVWSDEARKRFDSLQLLLQSWQIPFRFNPHLVRGLDYYQDTVFEWVACDNLGAQNTVCAGGRYDRLVETLGGPKASAFGFAAGLDRLLLMPLNLTSSPPRIAVIVEDDACYSFLHSHLLEWRKIMAHRFSICLDSPAASLKSQRKCAQKLEPIMTIQVDQTSLEDKTFLIYSAGDHERCNADVVLDRLTRLKEA